MADVWNKISKPTDASWGKVAKPTDVTTTTSTPHTSGKFMGILGLTYPGTSITTQTIVTWAKVSKPTDASWSKTSKPTS